VGTRNLTIVVVDGKTKVSQYGQWDGYPDGNGVQVLEFLRNVDLSSFKDQSKLVHSLTGDEIEQINKYHEKDWRDGYPQLDRDCGADILDMVVKFEGKIDVVLDLEFAYEGLFCEWAYLINLDNDTLEVYKGFTKKEDVITEGRWLTKDIPDDAMGSDEYGPIKILKKYDLECLPTDEQFLSDLMPEEDE